MFIYLELCSDGHFALEGKSAQSICPTGFFGRNSDEGERYQCNECERGKYGNELGLPNQYRCKLCGKGLYSDVSALTAGLTTPDGPEGCKRCATGRYGKTMGLSSPDSCKSCPGGFIQAEEGQSRCEACMPGQAQRNLGATECLDCLMVSDFRCTFSIKNSKIFEFFF